MSAEAEVARFLVLKDRARVAHRVRRKVRALARILDCAPETLCVAHAVVGREILAETGVEAVLQAGTAGWWVLAPWEKDDGVRPTHFAYEFDAERAARDAAAGVLPEVHAWLAIPEAGEVVDFTLWAQPAQAARVAGVEWRSPRTRFFWGGREQARLAGYVYRPDPFAIAIAEIAASSIAELLP